MERGERAVLCSVNAERWVDSTSLSGGLALVLAPRTRGFWCRRARGHLLVIVVVLLVHHLFEYDAYLGDFVSPQDVACELALHPHLHHF